MAAKFVLSEYTLAHICIKVISEGSTTLRICILPDVGL